MAFNKKQLAAFKLSLITATVAGSFLLEKSDNLTSLVAEGLAIINPNVAPDADGKVQVKGTELLTSAPAVEVKTPAAKPVFNIDEDVPLIAGVRGGVKEEVYPFSKLEIGKSFVVPVNAVQTTPELMVEKFSSTVSSATRRFAVASTTETRKNDKGVEVPKMVATRKFTLRPVVAGTKYDNGFVEPVSGARVYRTA